MKRLFHSAILWRLAAFAVFFVVVDLAAVPPVLGSGPTLAVTAFNNAIGAPEGTVSAMSSALYAAIEQTGKFTAVGGGALDVKPGPDGSIMGQAIAAAESAGASEVVVSDLVSASGGSVVYRLAAYRVAPLAFIRAQVFSQSSLASTALVANFAGNINTLEAPRSASGLVYSVNDGIHADLGAIYGFKLGEQFNVMRAGTKVADAQIDTIDDDSATVTISNPVAGYNPAVGDQLIGLEPLPAINPPPRKPSSSYTIWGLLLATGGALVAIGHHGQAAHVNQGPPVSPTPGQGFTVSCGTQTGRGTGNQSFQFFFSQPVNQSSITFSSPNQVYFTTNVTTNPTPVTALNGSQTFDGTSTQLTITGSGLVPGQQITFNFLPGVQDQNGDALTPQSCQYTLSLHRHPAVVRHIPVPPAPHRPGH